MSAHEYAKAVIAILGAGVTAALGIWSDGDVGNALIIASALLTAAGVYLVPNREVEDNYIPDAWADEA